MKTVTTTITEAEFVHAQRLHTKPGLRLKIVYWVGAVLLLVVAVFGNRQLSFIATGSLIGGYLGSAFMTKIVAPRSARKNYRLYKLIQKPVSILALPEGIFFKGIDGEALLKWESMLKWRENSDLILIYIAPSLFHVIPKHLASQGLPVAEISTALRAKVGTPA